MKTHQCTGAKRLSRGELGHGLGALRHGVLGQLTGQDQVSKMSLMKEFMMDMALEEIPVSGCTCFSTSVGGVGLGGGGRVG